MLQDGSWIAIPLREFTKNADILDSGVKSLLTYQLFSSLCTDGLTLRLWGNMTYPIPWMKDEYDVFVR